MSNKPIKMNKIRLIMQGLSQGRGLKELSRNYGVSRNTIKKYRDLLQEGTKSVVVSELDDEQLEKQLRRVADESVGEGRYCRLLCKKEQYLKALSNSHMTKQLLWEQYIAEEGESGYRNSQFSYYLQKWQSQQKTVMVLGSSPGEKLEVDYAGDKLKYIEGDSGAIRYCDVLVCVLPYSDLIYCEAQADQTQMNFVEGIGRALQYIGGVPKLIISDNLKSGIKKADRYEPELTELCEQVALYYKTHMTAVRVRKPRDKASVERSVALVYQRIYAVIENRPVFSLMELNQLMARELEHLNNRLMGRSKMSRWEEYRTLEKPHMLV